MKQSMELSWGKVLDKRSVKQNTLEKIEFLKKYKSSFFDEEKDSWILYERDLPVKKNPSTKNGYLKKVDSFPANLWHPMLYPSDKINRKIKAFSLCQKDIDEIKIFWDQYYSSENIFTEYPKLLKKIEDCKSKNLILKSAFQNIDISDNFFHDDGNSNFLKLLFLINNVLNINDFIGKKKFKFDLSGLVYWNEKHDDFYKIIKLKNEINWIKDTKKLNVKINSLKKLRNLLTHNLSYKHNEKQTQQMVCNKHFWLNNHLFLEIIVTDDSNPPKARKLYKFDLLELQKLIKEWIEWIIKTFNK